MEEGDEDIRGRVEKRVVVVQDTMHEVVLSSLVSMRFHLRRAMLSIILCILLEQYPVVLSSFIFSNNAFKPVKMPSLYGHFEGSCSLCKSDINKYGKP